MASTAPSSSGVTAGWEVTIPRNQALYYRHGFKVIEELTWPGGGPPLAYVAYAPIDLASAQGRTGYSSMSTAVATPPAVCTCGDDEQGGDAAYQSLSGRYSLLS